MGLKNKGYTLMELMVCLGVMSLSMVAVLGVAATSSAGSSRALFESECQTVLTAITDARDAAVMAADNYGTTVKVYGTSVGVLQYNAEKNAFDTNTIRLKNSRITSNIGTNDFVFNGAGVVSKGATLTFYRNNKATKYLVIQPVTGRIYLTDEKPK